ncbi:MAG: class I SAM-dependent methyltransferase [Bacteroidota bacterium]|jgi:ubiquinone/menaquinone biosynthesis C-methylase UbiE
MTTVATERESNIELTSAAFSAQAAHFDTDEESNRILKWMREQVYRHEEEFLLPHSNILELNAGTGIDAIHFARMGHSVFAIDNAPGMIHQLQNKISTYHFEDRIRSALCSFTQLQTLPVEQFDHVFSNFGGLNCIPNLQEVISQLPRLLKPGATITFVIMPRICPWEIAQAFRGRIRLAFRRFPRNGTSAHIDGHRFLSYYYSPSQVIKMFGARFVLARLRGLASFSPPPYYDTFPVKHPRIYDLLTGLDEGYSTLPPLNRWADHFIITMKYLP